MPARGAALAQQEVPVRAGPAAARARRRRVERVAVRRRARARGRRDVFPKLRRIRFRISRGRRRDAFGRFRHLAIALGEPASVFATSAIARSTKRVVSSRGGSAVAGFFEGAFGGSKSVFVFVRLFGAPLFGAPPRAAPPTSGARGRAPRGAERDLIASRGDERHAEPAVGVPGGDTRGRTERVVRLHVRSAFPRARAREKHRRVLV